MESATWLGRACSRLRRSTRATTRRRGTHVEQVAVRELDALNLTLKTHSCRLEVLLHPERHLARSSGEVEAVGVGARVVRRQRVVVGGPLDRDELVVLVLEGNCGRASELERRAREARAREGEDALPQKPAAKLSADACMRSCEREQHQHRRGERGRTRGSATHLALGAEDGLLALLEQVAVLGAERHAEVEQLLAAERRENLGAELVLPVVEEREVARPASTTRARSAPRPASARRKGTHALKPSAPTTFFANDSVPAPSVG